MKNLPVIYWVFLVACPVLSLASLLVFDFYLMQAIDVNAFFVFIPAGCILFINLMLFYFFEAFSSQLRLKVVEELAKQERENYKVLQQTEDEIRAFKHDYRNHHLMLEEYLNKGDVKAALKYLGKIDEIFEKISSVVYTSNSALDAALNIGNRKAQAEGIVYKVLIQGNDIIHIDSADIGIFLSNAIDNAIEGCSDCDEKYIYTEVCITEEDLKIHIENTTKESKKKLNFITTKADKRNHGYGLKNMKSVVNKYNGDIKYNVNDNVFHLDALLNNICVK